MSTKLPSIKWAQRKDSIYVTIDLVDVTKEKVSLTKDKLIFSGNSQGNHYEIELKFFKEVDTATKDSKWKVQTRNVHFHILKKEKNQPFWSRLLEDKHLEKTNVTIDWDKFVDEDEDEAEATFDESHFGGGGSGFDFSSMMSNMANNEMPPPAPMDKEDLEYISKDKECPVSSKKSQDNDQDDDELLKDLDVDKEASELRAVSLSKSEKGEANILHSSTNCPQQEEKAKMLHHDSQSKLPAKAM